MTQTPDGRDGQHQYMGRRERISLWRCQREKANGSLRAGENSTSTTLRNLTVPLTVILDF